MAEEQPVPESPSRVRELRRVFEPQHQEGSRPKQRRLDDRTQAALQDVAVPEEKPDITYGLEYVKGDLDLEKVKAAREAELDTIQ
eukprot:7452493-Alexandrium_andersonii.AAC.1